MNTRQTDVIGKFSSEAEELGALGGTRAVFPSLPTDPGEQDNLISPGKITHLQLLMTQSLEHRNQTDTWRLNIG